MLACDACNGESDTCKECCPHDWDDHRCLNCGEEKDYGSLIDSVEYIIDTER